MRPAWSSFYFYCVFRPENSTLAWSNIKGDLEIWIWGFQNGGVFEYMVTPRPSYSGRSRVGYPNVYSIGTHTQTHKHFGFSTYMERKLHTLLMCAVCLWKEANSLHVLLAKHCGKPLHFPSKNIPSVVHFYPNRWSMLVLSEPSQGGEMWKKKGEVV